MRQLLASNAVSEPTLSVSPWFETRSPEYYDRLLAVSSSGDWNGWIKFFADGMAQLVEIGVRRPRGHDSHDRRFTAAGVLEALSG